MTPPITFIEPSERTPPSILPLAVSASPNSHLPVPSHSIFGIRFHAINLQNAVLEIERYISERIPRQVCLANAYTVAFCKSQPALRDVINRMDLILPDGMSIIWGSRRLGIRFEERVAGPDLMEALCARAAEKQYRVFLLGSSPETLERLVHVLTSRWPGLQLAGVHSPSMSDEFDEAETVHMLDTVHEARPDILFVGMSAPKQELWISNNLNRLQVPVSMGVGAAFDFISGQIPRAPQKMQESGIEWLYRLYCEPRRLWKRYLLGNTIFLSLLFKELLHRKLASRNAPHP
jgi:N-acetylglucosaminyldiphosphoundecaprenol N-acetyl-beta-D-mannosaminyltransferase